MDQRLIALWQKICAYFDQQPRRYFWLAASAIAFLCFWVLAFATPTLLSFRVSAALSLLSCFLRWLWRDENKAIRWVRYPEVLSWLLFVISLGFLIGNAPLFCFELIGFGWLGRLYIQKKEIRRRQQWGPSYLDLSNQVPTIFPTLLPLAPPLKQKNKPAPEPLSVFIKKESPLWLGLLLLFLSSYMRIVLLSLADH